METIVEILGLATKIDTTLIEVVVKIHIVSKIDVSKIVVSKTNVSNTFEEGRVYSLVDEVFDTLVDVVLSWTSALIDWMHVLVVQFIVNPIEVFFVLDVVTILLGE